MNNGYKKLNFDEIRIKIINFYNNIKQRLIGMTPLEAYRSGYYKKLMIKNKRIRKYK